MRAGASASEADNDAAELSRQLAHAKKQLAEQTDLASCLQQQITVLKEHLSAQQAADTDELTPQKSGDLWATPYKELAQTIVDKEDVAERLDKQRRLSQGALKKLKLKLDSDHAAELERLRAELGGSHDSVVLSLQQENAALTTELDTLRQQLEATADSTARHGIDAAGSSGSNGAAKSGSDGTKSVKSATAAALKKLKAKLEADHAVEVEQLRTQIGELEAKVSLTNVLS